jgi:hypothetical protein
MMKRAMLKWLLPVVVAAFGVGPGAAVADLTIDLQDLALDQGSYWNGSDESGGFTTGGAFFNNNYNPAYSSWNAWAYSNMTDMTTPGYANQYSAYVASGPGGTNVFGVAYTSVWPPDLPPRITLPQGTRAGSMKVTNTTYAYLSMRAGDDYAKKFGGDSGSDPDWFLLTVTGLDADDNPIAAGPVEFYLADYRFSDDALDYIIDDWTDVDLSSLVDARKLEFSLTSSDNHPNYGMNTPAYFAVDNINVIPEPSMLVLLAAGVFGLIRWCRRRG